MHLTFCPLFSSSSGNCTYVGTDRIGLLVDAGVSGARVEKELREIGVDPYTLSAILVTHEHTDHIYGVGVLSRRYDLPIYATAGTWEGLSRRAGSIQPKNRIVIDGNEDFYIGDMMIRPFRTAHDAAESCGYIIGVGRASVAIATDIGCVRQGWVNAVDGADIVLLESNYDPAMLQASSYPYELKRRIASTKGHLSNDDAGRAAVELVKRGVRTIMLGHLSRENNFPELAYQSVAAALSEAGLTPDTGEGPTILLCEKDRHSAVHRLDAD